MEFETEIENHLFVLPYNIKINKSINAVWVREWNPRPQLSQNLSFAKSSGTHRTVSVEV